MTPETRSGRGSSLVGAMLERRYRIDSLIARGGMSAVYRGLDTRLHRPVAIKVMDSRYSADPSFINRFEREAQAAARLHHPHVVAVYDQGVDQGQGDDEDYVYLVMQLVEGCTLRDVLTAQDRLPLPVALSVMEPMLSALTAAHRAGMVHRDIKPENVLIAQDGSVKVADFGLVRAAASAGTTSGSVILGTVAYLAPEQVTTGAADAHTDVYAAGIVFYEMLTGSPPYVGDTALSVAYRHVNDNVPAPSGRVPELPPAIDDLVVRATRRDASVRPEDAATFLTELQRERTHLNIEPLPVPIPASEHRTERVEPDFGGPPTDQIAPVPAAPVPAAGNGPHHSGGPQGTRAMLRPEIDAEKTADMAAVRAPAPAGPPPRARPHLRRPAVWVAMLLALVALAGGTLWWMSAGRYVDVPRVEGEPEAVAEQVLRGAGLVPEIERDVHNVVPEGTVISSDPARGSRILSGKTVKLLVSSGRPRVPAIAAGASVTEAESALRDTKLRPQRDTSSDQYHPTVPEGRVIGTNPPVGTRVAISSQVTLVVSKGPKPVNVPEVRGTRKEEAFAALRKAGFEPFEAGRQFSLTVEGDHVITTDPAPGTEVKLVGRPRVGVVLSSAITVPDLSGLSVQDAQQRVSAVGLTLNVQSFFQRPNSMIFAQFPPGGTKVQPGSIIRATAF